MIAQIKQSDVLSNLIKIWIPDTDFKMTNKYILSNLYTNLESINLQIDREINTGYNFYLFNILNRAQIKISAHMEDLVKMMDELMSWKFYTCTTKESDEEFINTCISESL
jgi:hypothetical protein